MDKFSSYQAGMTFAKAYRLVRGNIAESLSGYGLTPTHWSLLSLVIHASDGVRVTALAQQMAVKPPMITMLSDQLIEQGLINRNNHATDGRVKLLVPTKQGQTVAIKIDKHLNEEVGRLLAGATPSEVQTFTKVLQTIIRNAE